MSVDIKEKKLDLRRESFKQRKPRLWLARFHHVNVHNKPMEFGDKYRFLIPLYNMMDERDICCEKSVQCGMSEWMIVSVLHEASIGLRILYVMPNIDLRGKFVKDRVDRPLKLVPYYVKLVKESYGESAAIGLKHFGKGLLNFVGSNSPAEFISYPADALYIDEVDECNQQNLEMAPDRLDASDYKYERRIGNPSVENWGIDSHYLESSQGKWNIRCHSCNHWQVLNFFKNVIEKTSDLTFRILSEDDDEVYTICMKCGVKINRMKKGVWVDTFTNKDKKGRRVNQLFSANVTMRKLVDQYSKALGNAKKMQIFVNSKLGLPFSSSENKITYSLLKKAEAGSNYTLKDSSVYMNSFQRVYVGIDVGTYYYVIVRAVLSNGKRQLIDARKIEVTQHLVNYLKKIKNIKYMMIDEHPEIREVEKIKKAVPKLYSCNYHLGHTVLAIRRTRDKWKKEKRVTIDRTFVLDEVKADFVRQIMLNPLDAKDIYNDSMEDYGEYFEQLLSSTRIFVEEANQNRGRFEWRESGPDHFFHAEAYCKLAEMVDPNILQYYSDKGKEFGAKTKAEITQEQRSKKELVPTMTVEEKEAIDKGIMDIKDSPTVQKLSVINAENFLRNMFFHNEEFLRGKKDEDDE